MFYPIMTIEEIMPDLLIQDSYNGLGKPNNLPRYNTRSNAKLGRITPDNTPLSIPDPTQRIQHQDVQNGTKGVVPLSMMLHPEVEYKHKYGSVMLNGLDNGVELTRVNNGTWKP